jgi:hypothetical protein
MSSETPLQKTIQINPDFLKYTNGGKTRKKTANTPIKFKVENRDNMHAKTTKRKMLNYIRRKQESNYRNMMKEPSPAPIVDVINPLPKNDFEQSLEFLETITRDPKNATLKYRPPISAVQTPYTSVLHTPTILNSVLDENVAVLPPENVFDYVQPISQFSGPIMQLAPPQYGCLKGGTLPTYRDWRTKTQKMPTSSPATMNRPIPKTFAQNRDEMRKHLQRKKEEAQRVAKPKPAFFQEKQKRTVRRTFRVGKSKVYPKIGILVSNRTIRNNIQSKCQDLKTKSIEEVKHYLIKHGFIRVGSSTPNDVLRKMYETSMLMCGEIQNHNPENLLYNYLNNSI